MGFGLCAVGYMCLLLWHLGLDALGYVLISYGFFGVAAELKAYKGYKLAAIFAATCAPLALINLYLAFYKDIGAPELPQWLIAAKGVGLALLGVALTFSHCNATARIAREGGARVFALRASVTSYMCALFAAFQIAGSFSAPDGSLAMMIIVSQYLGPFLNALILFTCFTTITTKRRQKIEQEIIERESEEIIRKKLLKKKKLNGEEDEA